MRNLTVLAISVVLATAIGAHAAEKASDNRYPVTLSPQEALTQKAQMRTSLVGLRLMLAALADKDFAGVEKHVPELGHQAMPFQQKLAPTPVYQKLESQFRSSTVKIAEAARTQDEAKVLRAIVDTMGYCQSCHGGLRQEVLPAEPENTPLPK